MMRVLGLKKLILAAAFVSTTLLSYTATATTFKIATDSGAKGSPAGDAIEEWADIINKKTNGEVEFQIFYQNQLGGQQEVFDLLIAGDVDMMLNWPMTSYDKRLSVLYTPYMTFSWAEALDAYGQGGWFNRTLDNLYRDQGLKFFGAWPEGFTGIATRGKYATSIDGAKDIKVRIPPSFPYPQTLNAMGYQASSIDWGEVFTSIQTGVVDGEAANIIYYDYEYFRDVLDYYVRTKHMFSTGALTMNLDVYEELTPEQQQVFQESAQMVMEKQFKAAEAQDKIYVEKAKEAGMEYIEPSEAEIRAIATVVRENVWPLMEKEIGVDIMKTIIENAPHL